MPKRVEKKSEARQRMEETCDKERKSRGREDARRKTMRDEKKRVTVEKEREMRKRASDG
jgi:hypothetical protein